MGDFKHNVQLLHDMGLSSGDRLNEIIALRARVAELESALAKSASREAALVEKLKVATSALKRYAYGHVGPSKADAALAKIKEAS